MSSEERPAQTARTHQRRLRAKGLRPILIWVPDVTAPGYAGEALRKALTIASSPYDKEDQAFVDSLAEEHDSTS
jgi:hypothetical protein